MAVVWNVTSLLTTKTVGSLSDVVDLISWTASDSETVDGVTHHGFRNGDIGLAEPDAGSFTAYKDITKENAIAWAKAALGSDQVKYIEDGIAEQIKESKDPKTSSGVPF
tara:strand:+ start:386 stop:712 length:327 start_codon:yes stop_codon:yes gene_type:complete